MAEGVTLFKGSQYSPLHQGYFQIGETKFQDNEITVEFKVIYFLKENIAQISIENVTVWIRPKIT